MSLNPFLPYHISPKYNENIDELRGKNARTVVVGRSYNTLFPNAKPAPFDDFSLVDTDYYPVSGYIRQIATYWWEPNKRKVRCFYDNKWTDWKDL